MSTSMHYAALSVGIIVLVILVCLAVFAIIYFKKQMIRQPRETYKRLPSQYSYITPSETPVFTIPPYVTLEENVFEEGDESSLGSLKEDLDENRNSPSESPQATPTALGTPRISRPQLVRSISEVPGYTQDRHSYKYRQSLSSTRSGAMPSHKKAYKKSSLSPFGKMQVSIHFEANKNLLVVQVNGMYDLPQLRTSGVSTPYVRVILLTGKDDKETRTNFMNLSNNRICVFDRISLEKVKESTLKFVVLDYDRFSRSEFIADVLVPLSEINVEEGETILRKLVSQEVPDEDGERGQLSVSLCQEPRAGRLVVHVIKAENLPPPKSEDHLDTYVRVTYYVQRKMVDKRKTKVVKRTTFPVFNEVFVFEMKEEELTNSSITCEVFRGDFKLKAYKIGLINLGIHSFGSEIRHWNEMMSSPQKQVLQCHKLHT
ncbi:synaptotagmin-7-like [Actinia tenebrosa]|uniref:Synaptotagmin-7-like n=1 Tax=Actinia tenebrosa TaxID=6105 RepID=A0A6P8HYJ1_ACTTE|nr:synaptotagmin-7-like [Actinia tenebrosa]